MPPGMRATDTRLASPPRLLHPLISASEADLENHPQSNETMGSQRDAFRSIPGIHQLSPETAFDRYPSLFSALVSHVRPRRVLSFGCSTGEECSTIRKYWPKAEVVGVDVNEASLDTARRGCTWARFHHVSALPGLGAFELVLAMSVLCRHRDTKYAKDISRIYPFQMFEDAVAQVVGALDLHGVLVILNANYRFEDSAHAAAFNPLLHDDFADEVCHARVRKFGPDGRVLADQRGCAVFMRTSGRPTAGHP